MPETTNAVNKLSFYVTDDCCRNCYFWGVIYTKKSWHFRTTVHGAYWKSIRDFYVNQADSSPLQDLGSYNFNKIAFAFHFRFTSAP